MDRDKLCQFNDCYIGMQFFKKHENHCSVELSMVVPSHTVRIFSLVVFLCVYVALSISYYLDFTKSFSSPLRFVSA